MTKQEVLNKAWYKLKDAIDDAKQLNQFGLLLMEMKAAIDIGEGLEDEQFSETYKRLCDTGKEIPYFQTYSKRCRSCTTERTMTMATASLRLSKSLGLPLL